MFIVMEGEGQRVSHVTVSGFWEGEGSHATVSRVSLLALVVDHVDEILSKRCGGQQLGLNKCVILCTSGTVAQVAVMKVCCRRLIDFFKRLGVRGVLESTTDLQILSGCPCG